jgi:hypothetical protein
MERETLQDPGEGDLLEFLQRAVNLLIEFTDRLRVVEQRLVIAESIPDRVAQELAAAIRQVSERVDEHDGMLSTVEQMGGDFRNLLQVTKRIEEKLSRRRWPPRDPSKN